MRLLAIVTMSAERAKFLPISSLACVCLVLGSVLIAFRCTFGDSSSDPAQSAAPLQVVSTYPPNGGIGPFDLHSPKPDTVKAHFYVRFNKSMDLASFDAKTITCAGFAQPVVVRVLNRVSGSGDYIGFQIRTKVSDGSAGVPLTYRVDSSYSISIDPTVRDDHGNQLGHQYKFSFTPEPHFRVVGMNFTDGDTLIPSSVEIFFNSKLLPDIRDAITFSPPLSDFWTINGVNDSSSILFNTYGRVTPATLYEITIAQGAHDVYGNLLPALVHKSFLAPPLLLTHNQFGTTAVKLAAQVIVYFNYPMNAASIGTAFSFEPATQLVQEISEKQTSFFATADFVPNSDYTIHFSSQLTTKSGYQLPDPFTLSFHTAEFVMTHYPAQGETRVSIHNIMEFDFTGAIVTSTAAQAITVTPPIDHHLTFNADTPGKYTTIFFVPTTLLTPGTRYHVIVSDSIRSIGGYKLAQPDTFWFQTASGL